MKELRKFPRSQGFLMLLYSWTYNCLSMLYQTWLWCGIVALVIIHIRSSCLCSIVSKSHDLGVVIERKKSSDLLFVNETSYYHRYLLIPFNNFIFTSILSWRRSLSFRSQHIDLQSKSMDLFLYDRDLRHEIVKGRCTRIFRDYGPTLTLKICFSLCTKSFSALVKRFVVWLTRSILIHFMPLFF